VRSEVERDRAADALGGACDEHHGSG